MKKINRMKNFRRFMPARMKSPGAVRFALVLHPYQMVKDHRISLDIGNVNDVLDGGIDPFIEGVLLAKKHK